MTITLNIKGIFFDIEIIRKKTIKNIYMRLKESNKIEIKTNNWIDDEYLLDFIYKKSNWILKKYHIKKSNMINNDEMLYLGKKYKKTEKLFLNQSLDQFYKENAISFITPIVEKYSILMDLYPKKLKYRKNKSRWGSCSTTNNINLNTQLMKHHIKFIEYVVVHELAHIKYKNHQKEFWNLVEQYLPDYKKRKQLYNLID